jgi:ornithine carbamoyltransferase
MQNFLSILDLNPDSLVKTLESAARLKRERVKGMKASTAHALNGRHVGLLFEKPSLRTRVTFTSPDGWTPWSSVRSASSGCRRSPRLPRSCT